MSAATLEWMRKERAALEVGVTTCMGCGAEIPIEYDMGHPPLLRWTCGTLRCNKRMIATHIVGLSVIEGGHSDA